MPWDSFAASPDGRRLLIWSAGEVTWLDLAGNASMTLKTDLKVAGFMANDDIIVAGGKDRGALVWTPRSGATRELPRPAEATPGAPVLASAIRPDGKQVAIKEAARLVFHDVETGKIRHVPIAASPYESKLAYSRDGVRVALALDDHVFIAESTGDAPRTVTLRTAQPTSHLALSPSGDALLVGRSNGHVVILNLSGDEQLDWNVGAPASSVDWSPDGRTIAVAVGGRVLVRRLTDHLDRTFVGHTADITDLAFSPDSLELATADKDGTVRVWSLEQGARRRLCPMEAYGTNGPLRGRRILGEATSGRLVACDVVTGEMRPIGGDHDGQLRLGAVRYGADGVIHAIASGKVAVVRGDHLTILPIAADAVAPTDDGELAYTHDGRLWRWHPGRGAAREVARLMPGDEGPRTTFADNGRFLLLPGDRADHFHVIDTATGARRDIMTMGIIDRDNVRASSEGLVATGGPGALALLDATGAARTRRVKSDGDQQHRVVAMSRNGVWAVTGGDGPVRLFDIRAGHVRRIHDLTTGDKTAAGFSEDDDRVAVANKEHVVVIDLTSGEQAKLGHTPLGATPLATGHLSGWVVVIDQLRNVTAYPEDLPAEAQPLRNWIMRATTAEL